jgi:hypothetical protein
MFDVCRFFWIISLMSFIIIPCVWIPAYVRGQAAPGSPSEFPAHDNGPGGSSSPSEFPTRRSLCS